MSNMLTEVAKYKKVITTGKIISKPSILKEIANDLKGEIGLEIIP